MSNLQRPINVGIIGCGKAAERRHLPGLRYVPAVRVIAAADVDPGRLKRVADRFGIEHRFADYRAILERADVDAVAILTPPQLHTEMGLTALDAGKHVLIEKPLTLTLAECDQLIEGAARSSGKVMVGFNLRWHRLVRRAHAFIQSGALGQIKALRSVYTHWRPGEGAPEWHKKRELGGGIAFNEAVHHFDLWRFLAQSEIAQIFAVSNPSEHYDDETEIVTARMANGVLASGVFSFKTSVNSEVEIYGEAGRLYVSCYRFDGFEFFSRATYAGDLRDRFRKIANAMTELPQALPIIRRGGDFDATFGAQWRHFADCIRYDRMPECTLADGKHALQIALAALESAAAAQPVQIPEGTTR